MSNLTPDDMEYLDSNPSGSLEDLPDNVKQYFDSLLTSAEKLIKQQSEDDKDKDVLG